MPNDTPNFRATMARQSRQSTPGRPHPRDTGGAPHQHPDAGQRTTPAEGAPVSSNHNSLRADPQGGHHRVSEARGDDRWKAREDSVADHSSEVPDVATGPGLDTVHEPANTPPLSDARSIPENAPDSFHGRTLGILMTDGIDDALLDALIRATTDADGLVALIAPMAGGITTGGGVRVVADQTIDDAPSALYDAVAVLATDAGAEAFAEMHPARYFAADAFAQAKFIAMTAAAETLFDAAGVSVSDQGMFDLSGPGDAGGFIRACHAQRYWKRLA
ncbi:DJ-1/PfpI family protein [Roseicitreum antarcticum]|uniref:catalase n=1 Tax=Roseicitreum antarcticum TaxID=564137 RepID=A0A1H2YTN8_9RHOB|nr:DJ-1/PfpI family protein [Roseicitreum antarcticum]SDX08506.1 DJ-1/PfpI family protein [Roseicitreum antarcticum]